VLDHEIKEIMLQIIPAVKQQMNGVCSEQVLHNIQQLITSLTRLQLLQSLPQGTASARYDEFSRFFHRQLDSILHDSLAKFEGRKYDFCCFGVYFSYKDICRYRSCRVEHVTLHRRSLCTTIKLFIVLVVFAGINNETIMMMMV